MVEYGLAPYHGLLQEAVEKYQQSKRELDEVVAQMESLVRPSCLFLPVPAHLRESERLNVYIPVTSITAYTRIHPFFAK